MIERYTREQMAAFWTDQARYERWLDIELALVEVFEEDDLAPVGTAAHIRENVTLDPDRINQIERETKHDVIAFLTHVEEQVGAPSRFVHKGLTSSDVLDTCLAIQFRDASDLLIEGVDRMLAATETRAMEHRLTPMIGRSHGIHAEPVTFGLVMAQWHEEMKRNRERLVVARDEVAVGKLSGAVGTFANTPPEYEERVMAKLGLGIEPISTQVVQRDRHAAFFSALAIVAASIEKFGVQVRHWQRTEVLEAEERFSKGQKGSSAMPHKRNPVLSENVCGLARLVRSHAIAALENVALWHERDISHSSVERVIAPDATITLDFMLHRFAGVVEGLVVYPENMQANLDQTRGLVFSQRVLLALVDTGLPRQEAYVMVQRNAMPVWEEGRDFLEMLLADAGVQERLGEAGIRECFDMGFHQAHVDDIFKRVFQG
ncbi:MAG: adenylosuccinate lyase [Myxococcota bacterium]|nr:adenylosuccinate lyase [Myxococcota bacterium]